MKNSRLKVIFGIIALLLLIPFVAMQVTDQVSWNLLDFSLMGFLLTTLGLSIELVFRKVRKFDYRMVVIGILVLCFLLVWAELAVGVFNSPFVGS